MMKRIALVLLSIVALVAFATPALAASGGDEGHIQELIWQAVNLAILMGVIFYFARKPITLYFADRRSEIQSDIKKADELLSTSRSEFAQWQAKLSELQREVETIREETLRRAQEERESIIAAAHDAAERIKSDAVAAIDQELRRAHVELHDEAASLAVDLAHKMLKEQVDDRDRDRLMDEFIVGVEPGVSKNPANNPANGQGN